MAQIKVLTSGPKRKYCRTDPRNKITVQCSKQKQCADSCVGLVQNETYSEMMLLSCFHFHFLFDRLLQCTNESVWKYSGLLE